MTLTVSYTIYTRLSQLLLEEICRDNYYSGYIEITDEEVHYHLSTSIFIYRPKSTLTTSDTAIISDIVPVWWELVTTTLAGEQLNDFDFRRLKNLLCTDFC